MTKTDSNDTNCDLFYVTNVKNDDLIDIYEIEKLSFASPWTMNIFMSELESESSKAYKVVNNLNTNKTLAYLFIKNMYHEIHIMNLAVHPEYRSMGLAKMLLSELISTNIESQNIFLEVRVSNIKAIKLYESFGFIQLYLRNKYYQNGEDAIIMLLETKNGVFKNEKK